VERAVAFARNSPEPSLDDAWRALHYGRLNEPLT